MRNFDSRISYDYGRAGTIRVIPELVSVAHCHDSTHLRLHLTSNTRIRAMNSR